LDAVLRKIPALVDGAMLALAYGGPAEVVVQDETPAVVVAGPALVYGVRDAHICGGVKGRTAHDLVEIGGVHRVGSMKGRGE
jgi:hypothetical protein